MYFAASFVYHDYGSYVNRTGRAFRMAITFVPDAGDVLMCDFRGLVPPEMTKVRHVIVLSPRSRNNFPGTYLVVPVSKQAPSPPEQHHHEFKPRCYDFFDLVEPVWAKADMMTCVSASRLDRVKVNGNFSRVRIRKEDLACVRQAVLHALGMEEWQQVVEVKIEQKSIVIK